MRIRKRLCLISAMVFICSLLIAMPSFSADVELKLAHTMSVDDTMHKGILKFAELVKEKTNNEVEITVYPSSQLGNDPEVLQGLRLGTIDMAMNGNTFYSAFDPSLNVLDLPYLFRDFDHAYKVLDGKIGKEMLARLEKHGIKGLGFMEIGFRNLTNNEKPVKKPEDVEGLKLRTTPNRAHVKAWKILGAIPTPMPFTELFMALKTNAVDGQENPITLIHGQKFYEVQKYLSMTMHAYTTSEVSMNLNKFNALSPEHQEVLFEAVHEAAEWHRNLNRKVEDKLLKEMVDDGLVVVEAEREAFAAKVREAVREDYAKKYGYEIINKIDGVK